MRRGYIHKAPWISGRFGRNVGSAERWISLAAALGLAVLARGHRNRRLALLASTFLMRRGLSGRCPLYDRLGLSSV